MKNKHMEEFPCLSEFASSVRVSEDNLVAVLQIEREFHEHILNELDSEKRMLLYADVYSRVHPLLKSADVPLEVRIAQKLCVVHRFRKELTGKSILDVGCGDGAFLSAVQQTLPHKNLIGMDVSVPENAGSPFLGVSFVRADIINFDINETVDVVFSDNVMEHIAPQDIEEHLASIQRALKPRGLFIMVMPNRLFGPSDVTRIIDNSNSGKTPAQGTHLMESTYTEMVALLHRCGFKHIKAVPPLLGDKGLRVSPYFFQFIERHHLLLRLLHSIRRKGKPIYRMPVTLISSRET